MPVDTKKTASQIGAEAASVLVANRESGPIWMECFGAALAGVCANPNNGDVYRVTEAMNVANEAYAAILTLAQQHRDSLVVR